MFFRNSLAYDSADVGNLISSSSAFSKSCLNIWKFTVHIVLKPGLENFEHFFASMWWVQLWASLNILCHCPSLGLEWKLAFSRSVTPRNRDPARNWPRLACECPGVSGGGMGSLWPAAGLGSLHVAVCVQDLLKEVAIIFITSTIVWSQIKHSPTHQQKIGLKIYRTCSHPSEQGPISPSVSLSHQEAFISLLSFSIRGQTEWKPQSQNHLKARWNTICEYFISNDKR